MKKSHVELTYAASPEQVFAMLFDPAYREQVCEDQRVLSYSVAVDGEAPDVSVRIEQTHSTAGEIPAVAQKVVGDKAEVHQEEQWNADGECEFRLTMPGKPGEVVGTSWLEERDGGTARIVDLQAKVSIPVVGGKLEGVLVSMIEKSLAKEQQTGNAWLAR